MATGSINLNANLTLNTQSLNAASKQAQQALGRITGQASEFQKSLDASTARVFAFGATTSILNGVSQAFKSLISNTIEVEKRINEIGSILGGTNSQLNALRNTVFAVAKDTGQAFGTVADAAAELARQGLSAEETSKRLNAALVLTRVSGLDSVKSVKALTSAINGFTSAGLTAEQITNKLVAVDTKFAVSAQDLAEGFSRAGSTAEDAGVSFDELLGIITAVEQKTARGGAVIGNALKSIFARLGRAKVIDDLRELGVEIDSSQTGIQKLQALSGALENVADPTVASKIKELAGGVFQINVVSAALKDLGSDTSIFAAAAKTAAGATNEAFTKNAQLNQTISAQINSLINGLTNLSEKIGTVTFGPIIKNLLSLANTFTTYLEKAFDPDQGNKFIQGLFKGIGAFLSGPGLVIITTAFLKIFTLVAKFAKEGFKTILDIGSQSEKIKGIEGGIVGLLARDQQLRAVIASTTTSQAVKEAEVVAAIQRENILLTQQEKLLRSIATAAAQRGVSGYSQTGGFSGKGGKRFATGYMEEEATAKMLGASPSVRAKQSKGTIGGQRFIMNNQETEIPNFGRNGDSAVIPHYANGFIPNYALATISKRTGYYTGSSLTKEQKEYNEKIQKQKEQSRLDKQNLKDIRIKSGVDSSPIDANKVLGDQMPRIFTPLESGRVSKILKGGSKLGYPDLDTKFNFRGVRAKTKNTELRSEFSNFFDKNGKFIQFADNTVLKFARNIASSFSLPPIEPTTVSELTGVEGFKGAIRGAMGAIFDRAIISAVQTNASDDIEGNFDINARKGGLENVEKVFGKGSLPSSKLADLKIGIGGESPDSMIRKTLNTSIFRNLLDSEYKQRKIKEKDQISKFEKNKNGKAAGFIPNFNSVNKGVPVSQIRAHFDQSGNPIAVTNIRDEPNGLKDAIGREKQGIGMAARGFIPNYAPPRGVPAGMSTTGLTLPPLPNIAPKVQQLSQSVDTGKKAFDKFGAGSLAASFALSLIPQLIPEIKDTDSALAKSSKSMFETVSQFASIGSAFGPLGTAAGAAAGAIYGAYKNISDALNEEANANKELEQTTKDVNNKLAGLKAVENLTSSALNLGNAFDESGNRIRDSKSVSSAYNNIIATYKAEGQSTDAITNAKKKAADVLSNSTSSQEEKDKASEEYSNILNSAMANLSAKMMLKADEAEKKMKFDKLNISISKFSEVLEKQAVKLDQQKFAEGIASNVTMPANTPYSEATKAAIGIQQSQTTATESKLGFMKNFAGSDFSNMLNDVQKNKMLGKSGAEISGAVSKDVFAAYMKDGAVGAGKALDNYLKDSLNPEDSKKFKDDVISSAATLRNNIGDVMQKALNRETEVQNSLSELTKQIQEAGKTFMAEASSKIKELMGGPKLDPLALQTKLQEAGKLLGSGKKEDIAKGRNILSSTADAQKAFEDRFGRDKLNQFQRSAGLTPEKMGLGQGSALLSSLDLSGIKNTIMGQLSGSGRRTALGALESAQEDPTKLKGLIDVIKEQFGQLNLEGRKKGKTIVNTLESMGDVTKDPATADLEKQKTALNAELGTLKTKISELNTIFGDTGIPQAVTSLTKSVKDAANNLAGFTDFTKNLSSLSNDVNNRLLDIEKKLGKTAL
jgi:TP901 family phage tail tape measure protein